MHDMLGEKKCADCGVALARDCTYEVCPRCLMKRGGDGDEAVHTRSIRRAIFEFRASCTYSPPAEAQE